MSERKTLTTAAGVPVSDNQTSLTAGERGPTLMQDHHLLQKLAHFTKADPAYGQGVAKGLGLA